MDRKFYVYSQQKIQYQWKKNGLFKSYPYKWYTIMLYEENGNYYELLTGQFLGTKESYGYYQYVFSDEFGYSVPLSGGSIYLYAHSVTPEDFEGFDPAAVYPEDFVGEYLSERADDLGNLGTDDWNNREIRNN